MGTINSNWIVQLSSKPQNWDLNPGLSIPDSMLFPRQHAVSQNTNMLLPPCRSDRNEQNGRERSALHACRGSTWGWGAQPRVLCTNSKQTAKVRGKQHVCPHVQTYSKQQISLNQRVVHWMPWGWNLLSPLQHKFLKDKISIRNDRAGGRGHSTKTLLIKNYCQLSGRRK